MLSNELVLNHSHNLPILLSRSVEPNQKLLSPKDSMVQWLAHCTAIVVLGSEAASSSNQTLKSVWKSSMDVLLAKFPSKL